LLPGKLGKAYYRYGSYNLSKMRGDIGCVNLRTKIHDRARALMVL